MASHTWHHMDGLDAIYCKLKYICTMCVTIRVYALYITHGVDWTYVRLLLWRITITSQYYILLYIIIHLFIFI